MGKLSSRTVIIRADASAQIGGGHVMRCLALADVLAGRGAEVTFACRAETPAAVPMLAGRGYGVLLIEGSLAEEPAYLERAEPEGCQSLIVDHYGWGAAQETACRSWARKILVIDDLANRHHDCDFLLDQNLGRRAEDYAGLVPPNAQLLVGPAYALLRPEFARARAEALARRAAGGPVRRILVSLGLTDPGNATGGVLEALAGLPDVAAGRIELRVVLGRAAPYRAGIEAQARTMGDHVSVLIEPGDMAAEMAAADLAIGAGGSSNWERCTLGLPTVVVVIANNQRAGAEALERAGAAVAAGLDRNATTRTLADLVASPARRTALAEAALRIADGRGARRVALALDPEPCASGRLITLRPIQAADEDLIYAWQTEPGIRRFARVPVPPTRDEHARWMSSKLADRSAMTMIVQADGEAVGLARLDPRDGPAMEVSLLISGGQQGHGIGVAALRCLDRLAPDLPFVAEIDPANTSSRHAFLKAGYRQRDARWHDRPPIPDDPLQPKQQCARA